MKGISPVEMRDNIKGIIISDEIPEDFNRAITVDEAKARYQKGLKALFKRKREQKTVMQ